MAVAVLLGGLTGCYVTFSDPAGVWLDAAVQERDAGDGGSIWRDAAEVPPDSSLPAEDSHVVPPDAGPTCGNGIAEEGEECDGSDVRGQTCGAMGFDGGDLRCEPDCQILDVSQCWSCGDGVCDSEKGESWVVCGSDCKVVTVSVYAYHTCAVDEQGVAWCWGLNSNGELGDGTTNPSAVPVKVEMPPGVSFVAIAVGENHTCALDDTGHAWCWGANGVGQLGDGTTNPSAVPVPVDVSGIGTLHFAILDAGSGFTCAATDGGRAYCWGSNSHGKLGDGSHEDSALPVEVAMDEVIGIVDVGDHHACARVAPEEVVCWGANDFGQLGDGTDEDHALPVYACGGVEDGCPASNVSCGSGHSCSLDIDGRLWCWGWNVHGQLGDGTTRDRRSPVRVDLPSDLSVREVVAGGGSTYVVDDSGIVLAWGSNAHGELGDGTCCQDRTSPEPVSGLGPVRRISAGWSDVCAVDEEGRLWCWGRNDHGQLGDGTNVDRHAPVCISGP